MPLSTDMPAPVRATVRTLQLMTAEGKSDSCLARQIKECPVKNKPNSAGGGHSVKEVRCVVCQHLLKRRKHRKVGVGPTCMKKLQNGSVGIQIEAFRDFDLTGWSQKINPKEE